MCIEFKTWDDLYKNEDNMTYIEFLEASLELTKRFDPNSPHIQKLEKQIDKYFDTLN